MSRTTRRLAWGRMGLTSVAIILLLTGTALPETDAERCEAAKLKIAAKYSLCRLKEESNAVKRGMTPIPGKCDFKYTSKWAHAEFQAGGQCPTTGDEATVQSFITDHTDALAGYLSGGTALPTCSMDLATCNSDLTTCNGSLSTCNSILGTCNGNLSTCSGNLSTCNSNYATCSSGLAICSTGTANQAEVLSGKSFSSASGLGLTGTMLNNGAVNITPGTTSQTIAAGYHNGLGTVAGDADLVAANIVNGVNVFGVVGTALGPAPLATGQAQCDQGAGTLGACPGSPAGQDGAVPAGTARSYTDNGDGTITDNVTGLMWEKLSDDHSVHGWDQGYTWYDAFEVKIAALNSGGGFAGHADWRLPNVNELRSLADYGTLSPAIDPVFNTGCAFGCTVTTCSCTQPWGYWSSTTYQNVTTAAWRMDFFDGNQGAVTKSNGLLVRAVRGGL